MWDETKPSLKQNRVQFVSDCALLSSAAR